MDVGHGKSGSYGGGNSAKAIPVLPLNVDTWTHFFRNNPLHVGCLSPQPRGLPFHRCQWGLMVSLVQEVEVNSRPGGPGDDPSGVPFLFYALHFTIQF